MSSMPGNQTKARQFSKTQSSKPKICTCPNPQPFQHSNDCANCGGDVTFNPAYVYEGKLDVSPERMQAVAELTQGLADWERDSNP